MLASVSAVLPAPMRMRFRLPPVVALAGLVLLAVAVRVALADRSLWLDELITLLKARESLPALLDGMADDVHPPLYYVMLHGWVQVAGDTQLAVRAPSIAWSAVTVLAIAGWSRQAFPDRSPLPAAAIAAVAPFAVWYGTEARMYAQVLALTAVAGLLAWKTVGDGPRPLRVAGLIATLAALAWTHYFGALFLVGLGIVAVTTGLARADLRAGAAWTCAACAVAGMSLLPWLAFVLEHRSPLSPTPTLYPEPDFFSVVIVAAEMLVGFHSFETVGLLAAAWPLLGLLALVLLPRMTRVPWRVASVAAMAAIPPAILVAASLWGPRSAFDPRFVAVSAVPLYLLVGALIAKRRIPVAVAAAALVAGVALSVWQNQDAENPKLYAYASAVDAVNARVRPGDAVLLLPNFPAAGAVGNPILDYYRIRPGTIVPDTRAVGQVSPEAVEARLRLVWRKLRRQRPARIYVIDSFADHARGRTASAAALRFLGERGRLEERVPFARASVLAYDVSWAEQ